MTRRYQRGFTLIEVLIALAIGSLLVLLTHQLFSAATEGTSRLADAWSRLEDDQLSSPWLHASLLSLEVDGDAGSFEGHVDHVAFTTWLVRPGGWMERTRVSLVRTTAGLEAQTAVGSIRLHRGVHHVEFDYLLVPGADSRWISTWISPVSAPLAVRVRLFRPNRIDTLLFSIGARG